MRNIWIALQVAVICFARTYKKIKPLGIKAGDSVTIDFKYEVNVVE